MIVTTREGRVYTVALGRDVGGAKFDLLEELGGKGTLFVEDYEDDFISNANVPLSPEEMSSWDIMKIEIDGKVLWER